MFVRSIGHAPALFFFFFNDTATTEIYTLSLHDALPIWSGIGSDSDCTESRNDSCSSLKADGPRLSSRTSHSTADRKSTRLNSSHLVISYAVFCLKKKKEPRNSAGRESQSGM